MIQENINTVKESIISVCRRAGRNIEDIKVIAVSKNTGLELIQEAIDAGFFCLGESKAQELSEKAKLLSPEIEWHFIGHLQKNKVKYVVPIAELIHSVDSAELAAEIDKQAVKIEKIQNVLIEVKTAPEVTKYGIEKYEDVLELCRFIDKCENLKLKGLMTIAPYTDDENLIRESFSTLILFRDELQKSGFHIPELSMGMTGDYSIAIEMGSTIVRIGTAIFGKRDYSKSWKEQ